MEPISNPKKVVRDGYDQISTRYRTDDGRHMPSDYAGWLAELTPHLPPGSPVLELGCGCGVPVAQALAPHFDYTGVDISPVQIERARKLVPQGQFVCDDMAGLAFADGELTAVLSFYALIHLPLAEQPGLLANIHRWLRPGGWLMVTVGHTAWTGTEENWLGAKMYWSYADADTYQRWLTELGFGIFWTRFIPEGDGGHTLIFAQKQA